MSLSITAVPHPRRTRIWRRRYGYLRCAQYFGGRAAGAVLCAAEHFRQHRQRADHRLQGHQHELRRPRAGCDQPGSSGRRRCDRLRKADDFVAGHGVGFDRRHLHGDQRRRLLLGAEVERHGRQRAGVHRCHQLHAPRRFPGQRQRQSRQRRRLFSDGRRGRFQDRQSARQRAAGAAIPEQLCAGAGDHDDSIRP